MRSVSSLLLAVTIAAGAAAAWAAEDASVMTPAHVARLQSVGEVVVSPDGQRVAFTKSVQREPGKGEDGPAWSELWVLDAAGSGPARPFVTGKVNVQGLAWTPDSKQIAFLAKRAGDEFRSLHLIPVDGGEARRAASLKSGIDSFSLSPDGSRVALVAPDPKDPEREKWRNKGFKQEVYEEDWDYGRLWLASVFGEDEEAQSLSVTGSVRRVYWSPAGDRLAVVVTPTPSVDDSLMRQQILIVGASTNAPIQGRVDHAGKLGQVGWSPDGQRLAMIAGEDLHDPSAGRLMVAPAAGGKPRDIVPGLEAEVSAFAWLGPDELAFVVAKGTLTYLARASFKGDTASITNVTQPGHPIISALSASRDGELAAIAGHTARHPAEVFTWNAGETTPTRRTDSNPWLANLRFASQEVIRYRARDGLDIEGVLIHPLERRNGERHPLILSVHGGPEAHISDGWLTSYSLPGQVAAARGFAVFYPNYRGSTGRGVTFSKLGQGDAAGKEFDDLVDGVDHLIRIGLVDRARVGITGGSYGGYATAWASTRYSDRFAAGVMFVGISDKISKVGTTDIADEEYLVHARKRPWENWQFLLERSPIFHAGNSRTPLLIMHGADDPRVHPGQSRELYRHLKLRSRAPVRLVLYPGEGHGNRKAAARYDYNLRMLRWFEHYLQGPGGEPPDYSLDYDLSEEGDKAEEASASSTQGR